MISFISLSFLHCTVLGRRRIRLSARMPDILRYFMILFSPYAGYTLWDLPRYIGIMQHVSTCTALSQGIGLSITALTVYHDTLQLCETEASISVWGGLETTSNSLAASLLWITTKWIPIASFWRNLLIFIVCTLRRHQSVCPPDTAIQVSWNPGIVTGLETSLIVQRSPTDGPRESFGGPWRNWDIICNVYVYYTVSLYSHSSSCP
jgi:hypothetical protein